MEPKALNKSHVIKNIYLYLVSFVALMMVVFSFADVVNIVLRTYIFTKADQNYYSYPVDCPTSAPDASTSTPPKPTECPNMEEQRKQDEENITAQRQRDLVRDISFVVVGIPLFIYHWRIIRKKEME